MAFDLLKNENEEDKNLQIAEGNDMKKPPVFADRRHAGDGKMRL